MEDSEVVIYLTHGVKGGLAKREELYEKFADKFPKNSLKRWKSLPSPELVTCAISDDLNDIRTRKLKDKGVPIAQTKWLEECILRGYFLLPIPEIFQLKKEEEISKKLIRVHSFGNEEWTKAEDDVLRAAHEYRFRGELEKALRFENLLVERNRSFEDIEKREKFLFDM